MAFLQNIFKSAISASRHQGLLSVVSKGLQVSKVRCFVVPPTEGVLGHVWRLGRLNHVAIAVTDLEKASSFYRDVMHATVSAPQALPEHGVTTVFIELDNTKLELLEPLGEKSPIESFLRKNKNGGLHHICIEVNDITAAMSDVTKAGVRCLGKEPKIGAHGKPVIFLHPADCNGVLMELEEV